MHKRRKGSSAPKRVEYVSHIVSVMVFVMLTMFVSSVDSEHHSVRDFRPQT